MPSGVRRRRGPSAEEGAALVEASVALILLVSLTLGIAAVAGPWGSRTETDRLAARAVRLAARVVDRPASDLEVLSLVAAGLGSGTLERLVVYRPTGPEGAPSSACAALRPVGTAPAGVAGWCTAFGPGHLAALRAGGATVPSCAPGSLEAAWCPSTRRTADGTAAWVGVLVEVRRSGGGDGPGSEPPELIGARAVAALDPLPGGRS